MAVALRAESLGGLRTSTSLLWFVVVAAQVVVTELSFERVGLTSQGLDISRWAILSVVLVLPVGIAALDHRLRAALSSKGGKWFVSLWGLGVLSTLWSVDPFATLVVSLTIFVSFAAGALASVTLGVDQTIRVALLGGIALLLGSVAVEVGNTERWSGLSDSPTSLARTGTFVVVLSALVIGQRRWGLIPYAAIVLGLGNVLLSQSRVTLLISLLALGIGIVRSVPAVRQSIVAAGLTAVALVGAVASWTRIVEVATRSNPDTNLTELNGRISVWSEALPLIADRPILGYGVGSGTKIWAEQVVDGSLIWNAVHSHQQFLEVALGVGVVGLVLYLGALAFTWRGEKGSAKVVSRSLVATVVAVGLTEANLEVESLLVFLLGVAVGAARKQSTAPPGGHR